jgi:hypothetical protein
MPGVRAVSMAGHAARAQALRVRNRQEYAEAVRIQAAYRGRLARKLIMREVMGMVSISTAPSVSLVQLLHVLRVLGPPLEQRPAPTSEEVGREQPWQLLDTVVQRIEGCGPSHTAGGSGGDRPVFFSRQPLEERLQLYHGLQLLSIDAGHIVFEQGEVSDDSLYFVVSGRVAVLVDGKQVAEQGYGSVFGERALESSFRRGAEQERRRTASILALEECLFATLTRAAFARVSAAAAADLIEY